MPSQKPQAAYPPTLVFNSLEGWLHAMEQRSIGEIGCVTLKRIVPSADGMLQRQISFLLLTARDPARNEVLVCSLFLKAGDFMDGRHLFTPAAEWQRQKTHAEAVQRQVQARLAALSHVRVVDAAYAICPDLCMRFAAFALADEQDAGNA
jgi:hypothetical protein